MPLARRLERLPLRRTATLIEIAAREPSRAWAPSPVARHPREMSAELYANTFCLWNRRRILAPLSSDLWESGVCRWDLFPAVIPQRSSRTSRF